MGNTLKERAVGSIVKLNVGGEAKEFIVVQHGKPSDIYDDSCNGTWLLMKECYEARQWHTSAVNDYANSSINSYLNGEFHDLIAPDMQTLIKQVKIPYRAGSGVSTAVKAGEEGLSVKVFLLGVRELGMTMALLPVEEGSVLSYFEGTVGGGGDSRRSAYLNGTVSRWWSRSPYCYSESKEKNVAAITEGGDRGSVICTTAYGIRPALVLDSELTFVSGDGTLLSENIVISGEESGLDAVRDDFSVGYTVTMPKYFGDSTIVSVSEYVNDALIRAHSVASGSAQGVSVLVDRLADGPNEIIITAEAEGMTAKKVVPFYLLPIAGNDNGTVQEFQDENGDPIFPVTLAKAVMTFDGESVERKLLNLGNNVALLWENASPASEFAAQKVEIDSYKYDAVIVCANFNTEETVAVAGLILHKGEVGKLSVSAESNRYRRAEFNDEGVVFSDGSYFGTYGTNTASVRNTDTIPLRIYGVKEVSSK